MINLSVRSNTIDTSDYPIPNLQLITPCNSEDNEYIPRENDLCRVNYISLTSLENHMKWNSLEGVSRGGGEVRGEVSLRNICFQIILILNLFTVASQLFSDALLR